MNVKYYYHGYSDWGEFVEIIYPTGRWRIVETINDKKLEIEFNCIVTKYTTTFFGIRKDVISTIKFVSENAFSYKIEYPIQDCKL